MRFFALHYSIATRAHAAVWTAEDKAQVPRTAFQLSAIGSDASTWTASPEGEVRLRVALEALDEPWSEADEQQVVTDIDRWFR